LLVLRLPCAVGFVFPLRALLVDRDFAVPALLLAIALVLREETPRSPDRPGRLPALGQGNYRCNLYKLYK